MSMKTKGRCGNLKSNAEMPGVAQELNPPLWRQEDGDADPADTASALQIFANEA